VSSSVVKHLQLLNILFPFISWASAACY
jgi:hypothetical protein